MVCFHKYYIQMQHILSYVTTVIAARIGWKASERWKIIINFYEMMLGYLAKQCRYVPGT